ncbi:MAG: hypothetical protein DWI48_07175, partial [Chloroflexi bacterium]
MRIKFASDHDILTVWSDIYTVRALWFWRKEENPFGDQRLDLNDWKTIDLLELACIESSFRFLC